MFLCDIVSIRDNEDSLLSLSEFIRRCSFWKTKKLSVFGRLLRNTFLASDRMNTLAGDTLLVTGRLADNAKVSETGNVQKYESPLYDVVLSNKSYSNLSVYALKYSLL